MKDEGNLKNIQAANYANLLKKLKAGKTLSAGEMRIVEDYENGKLKKGPGRPQKGSQELPVYTSLASCAAATGIPLMILKEAKNEGCEAFRFSRVELGKLLPFLFRDRAVLKQPDLGLDVSARNKVDAWIAKLKQLDYEERTGLVIPKQTVRAAVAAALPKFFDGINRVFCNELPPKLVGLREPEIRKKSAAAVDQLTTGLRESFEALAGPDGDAQAEGRKSELQALP